MKSKTETTIPVFANRAPWNELVLRGKRRVKTISFNWKYRGPILLYTSSNRVDDIGWEFYPTLRRTKLEDIPQGAIVGYVTVVDVVPTTEFEGLQPWLEVGSIFDKFFKHDPALVNSLGQDYVVITENPKRFKTPIPFKPKKGSIRIMKAPASYLKRETI